MGKEKRITQKLLELISDYSRIARSNVIIQNQFLSYISANNKWKLEFKIILYTLTLPKIIYFVITLAKCIQDLYKEDYKILMN